MTEKVLSGRIALITGASRGIGRETALAFARAGAHVIALARTVGGLEELDDAIKAEAVQPRWCRSTSRISMRWIASGSPSTSVGANSTCSSAMGDPRADLAAEPYRSQAVGARLRDQRDRELPPDPLHGPASARVGCGPRDLPFLGRGSNANAYWAAMAPPRPRLT